MSGPIENKTIDELIALALTNYSNVEQYEKFLWELRSRATAEMFSKAKSLCFCDEPIRRILGAQILCQLGEGTQKFAQKSSRILLLMLTSETNRDALVAIAWGLHHLKAKGREAPLIRLKNHPDAEVRLGVVSGLLGSTEGPAVKTLIELSSDVDHNVRSWATFGLGSQLIADSPEIRQALYDRLSDEDEETLCEAIWALSKKKDPRAIDFLIQRLVSDTVDIHDIEAAETLGAPRLLPALIRLRGWEFNGDDRLENAINVCKSNE